MTPDQQLATTQSCRKLVRHFRKHGLELTPKATKALLSSLQSQSYGFGVTAGKKEALGYDRKTAILYIKHVSFGEGFQAAKKLLKPKR